MSDIGIKKLLSTGNFRIFDKKPLFLSPLPGERKFPQSLLPRQRVAEGRVRAVFSGGLSKMKQFWL